MIKHTRVGDDAYGVVEYTGFSLNQEDQARVGGRVAAILANPPETLSKEDVDAVVTFAASSVYVLLNNLGKDSAPHQHAFVSVLRDLVAVVYERPDDLVLLKKALAGRAAELEVISAIRKLVRNFPAKDS